MVGTVLDLKRKWNNCEGSDLDLAEPETNGGFEVQEKDQAEITVEVGGGERQTSFITKNGGASALDYMPKEGEDGDDDDELECNVIILLRYVFSIRRR